MNFKKNNNNQWENVKIRNTELEPHDFSDKCLKILNCLEKIFQSARNTCEFEFIWTLLSIRGMQDAGWDPYETTVSAVSEVLSASNLLDNHVAQKNLQLWLYVHIMEASEPYEKIMNLLKVVNGGVFSINNFPLKGKRPWSPGEKIRELIKVAEPVGLDEDLEFLNSIWNRHLRNSISHSEYAFYPDELRTFDPPKKWPRLQIADKVNYAIAYHHAFQIVHSWHVSSYRDSKLINSTDKFSETGELIKKSIPAIIMIRKNHGVIGLKSAGTEDQVKQGAISWMAARLNDKEQELIEIIPEVSEFK